MAMTAHAGRRGLWSAVTRWTASDAEVDAEELRDDAQSSGCQPLAEVPDRSLARVRGTLNSVTLRPRVDTPALEADLFDGSDSVTLIWLGRRRIAGVSSGRRMVAVGRVTTLDGRRVMFNPRYELLPAGSE